MSVQLQFMNAQQKRMHCRTVEHVYVHVPVAVFLSIFSRHFLWHRRIAVQMPILSSCLFLALVSLNNPVIDSNSVGACFCSSPTNALHLIACVELLRNTDAHECATAI